MTILTFFSPTVLPPFLCFAPFFLPSCLPFPHFSLPSSRLLNPAAPVLRALLGPFTLSLSLSHLILSPFSSDPQLSLSFVPFKFLSSSRFALFSQERFPFRTYALPGPCPRSLRLSLAFASRSPLLLLPPALPLPPSFPAWLAASLASCLILPVLSGRGALPPLPRSDQCPGHSLSDVARREML